MDPTPRDSSLRAPLRILVIASTYPRHEGDYAVPWLRTSIQHLVHRGHQVRILAPAYRGLGDHEIDGVPVHRFRYSPANWECLTHEEGAPSRIRNHPFSQILGVPYVVMGWLAATRLARQHPFDIVHVHWPFPHGPIGAGAAKACNARLVMTSHGAEYALARRKRWIRPLLRSALRRADLLLANSSDTARHVEDISGRKAIVLPFGPTHQLPSSDGNRNRTSHSNGTSNGNGVANGNTHKPKFSLQNLQNGDGHGCKNAKDGVARVLFTGRLIQRKGVEYLLRAIPLILEHRRAEFIITGDGDQRPRLESLAHSLQLDEAVQFLGFVSSEQLDAEYESCDVWVNPAIIDDNGDTEGLGVGAIDAYAHHKAVVASAVGGIPDAVRHGVTGLLVPEKNEQELAKAILAILDNPQRAARMAEAGYRFAREVFDWENLTGRLEAMYYDLLAPREIAAQMQSESTLSATDSSQVGVGPLPEPASATNEI